MMKTIVTYELNQFPELVQELVPESESLVKLESSGLSVPYADEALGSD